MSIIPLHDLARPGMIESGSPNDLDDVGWAGAFRQRPPVILPILLIVSPALAIKILSKASMEAAFRYLAEEIRPPGKNMKEWRFWC